MQQIYRLLCITIILNFNKPVAASNPLPFMSNETWWVSQGWYGTTSHSSEKAVDFNYGVGTNDRGRPVLSTCDGSIVYADWAGAYGQAILIDCGGYIQRTGHHKQLYVLRGEHVSMGQVIGTVGNSAYESMTGSGGYHLHFNYLINADNPNTSQGSIRIPQIWQYHDTNALGELSASHCSSDTETYACQYTSTNSTVFDERISTDLQETNTYSQTFLFLGSPEEEGIHWWS